MAKPTNPKNGSKQGMSLHKWIATGGKPADYNSANKTGALRSSSKNTKQK